MKKTDSTSEDSDDERDELPLKYISSSHKKYGSLKELRRYSIHECEFCDNKFDNRYDYLIHNAKHIIIPLIKMLPYNCSDCGLFCLTAEELNNHMTVKHNTIKSKSHNDDDREIEVIKQLKFEIENMSDEDEDEKPLICHMEKDKNIVQNNISDNVLQNFVMNCKVNIEKYVPTRVNKFGDLMDHKVDGKTNTCECIIGNNVSEFELSLQLNNGARSDLNSKNCILECKPENVKCETTEGNLMERDVEKFDSPGAKIDLSSEFSDLDEDPIVILKPVYKEKITENPNEQISIHFDDLMKPGIFYCKRCFKRFPNRYEVIVHEIIHLDLSKAALKSNKLRRNKHMESTIPLTSRTTSKRILKCRHCCENIFDKKLHSKTCLELNCNDCGKGFHSKMLLANHENKCQGDAVVNICDICLYWNRRPRFIQYVGIVKLNKLEVKRPCDWCGTLSEDLSLVSLVSRERFVDRIRFEGETVELGSLRNTNGRVESQSSRIMDRGPGRKAKSLSNRERLKLIQHRLKLMKK